MENFYFRLLVIITGMFFITLILQLIKKYNSNTQRPGFNVQQMNQKEVQFYKKAFLYSMYSIFIEFLILLGILSLLQKNLDKLKFYMASGIVFIVAMVQLYFFLSLKKKLKPIGSKLFLIPNGLVVFIGGIWLIVGAPIYKKEVVLYAYFISAVLPTLIYSLLCLPFLKKE